MSGNTGWDFAAIDAYHEDETNGRDIGDVGFEWWDRSEFDGDSEFDDRSVPNGYAEAIMNNPFYQNAASSPVQFSSPPRDAGQQLAPPTIPTIRNIVEPQATGPPASLRPDTPHLRAEQAAANQQSHNPNTNNTRLSQRNVSTIPDGSRPQYNLDLDDSDSYFSSSSYGFGTSTVPASINMPAALRTRNSVVDLTDSPANTSSRQTTTRKRSAEDTAAEGSSKRKKRGPLSSPKVPSSEDEEAPSAEAELLKAQQLSALKAQEEAKDAPQRIGQRTCIICLENYTNATTAICGHIFCHECLTRALIASEKHSNIGNCPACRKPLSRRKKETIIPIAFLKKTHFASKGRPKGFLS